MYATECAIGLSVMTPETARDEMIYPSMNTSDGRASNAVSQLRAIAGLCNSGEFDASTMKLPLHERKINGDATDQAILRLSESLGSVTALREMWKKTFELAFNSKNKYMIRTLQLAEGAGLDFALPASEATDFHPHDT